MRSREEDKSNVLTLLKQVLINGPYHCFGYHTNCSPDFCQAARDSSAGAAAAIRDTEPTGNENTCTTETTDEDDDDTDITCKYT